MKIRTDFVTNSSSSSFIIMCNEVKLKDIDLKNGEFIAVGKYLGDGIDIIELDKKKLQYILAQETMQIIDHRYPKFEFFQIYGEVGDGTKTSITKMKQLIKDDNLEFEIREFEKDYHTSQDIIDIKERYYDNYNDNEY